LLCGVNCTHKMAQLIAPFRLDVDKAITAWNFTSPDDPWVKELCMTYTPTDVKNTLPIISGVTFGSSFVAMVHFRKTEQSMSSQRVTSVAQSVSSSVSRSMWYANVSGNFGLDSSSSQSAKQALSAANIDNHCTITCMGLIPTVKSNEISYAITKFSEDGMDPGKQMEALDTLNSASSGQASKNMEESAKAARTGQQMGQKAEQTVGMVFASLSKEEKKQKVFDTNALMDTLENYIEAAGAEQTDAITCGVPLNYYLHPITKYEIMRLYAGKYFPAGKLPKLASDDSAPAE